MNSVNSSLNPAFAISPLDGRYRKKIATIGQIASEFGLMKARVTIEIQWFIALSDHSDIVELPNLSDDHRQFLLNIIQTFDISDYEKIKEIERTTLHDVKAVEYFIADQFKQVPELAAAINFIHFACTSEDINNLSHALIIHQLNHQVLIPQLESVIETLINMSENYAEIPMLSRTHGQPASPTTLGKEIANSTFRLHRQLKQLKNTKVLAKINGAVGNFNAHMSAYPDLDWLTFSKQFIESLGFEQNPFTTQIEPHDNMAEISHNYMRLNHILIDFCRDVWSYISLGYFKQKVAAGQVGSSTMPHKVNPINFENAEGNLGLANALFGHFAEKLPISRLQRDLTDSTVIRNIGTGFGYTLLALDSLATGLSKIYPDESLMKDDINHAWELMAEPIQTILRKRGVQDAYEQLKSLTQNKHIDQASISLFIDQITTNLSLTDDDIAYLKSMSPENYIGYAVQLAQSLRETIHHDQ